MRDADNSISWLLRVLSVPSSLDEGAPHCILAISHTVVYNLPGRWGEMGRSHARAVQQLTVKPAQSANISSVEDVKSPEGACEAARWRPGVEVPHRPERRVWSVGYLQATVLSAQASTNTTRLSRGPMNPTVLSVLLQSMHALLIGPDDELCVSPLAAGVRVPVLFARLGAREGFATPAVTRHRYARPLSDPLGFVVIVFWLRCRYGFAGRRELVLLA